MPDDVNSRGGTHAASLPFLTEAEAINRLEPLSVPVSRLTSILRRHVWLLLSVAGIGIGGTAWVVQQMPREYTASATILIQPQRTQVSDLQAISTDPNDINSLIRTQIDILRSPALAMDVVKVLNLTMDPDFMPAGPGLLLKARHLVARLMHRQLPPQPPLRDADKIQIAGGVLLGKLSFTNEPRSSVLSVAVTTHDADLSALIANEVAKQFLDFKRREKFEAIQRAHDWFQEQMGKLASEVSEADRAVQQYRLQHGLDELPPDDSATARPETLNRQLLNAVNVQLAQAMQEIAQKEGRLVQAEAAMNGKVSLSAVPEVVTSPRITELSAQLATVAGHEAQLANTQGAGNPELASVRAQRGLLQARLAVEAGNIVKSLTAEIKADRVQEQSLRQQVEQLRAKVSTENLALMGLQVWLTKARATRSIYETFLNRATQLANVAGIQEQDATLVSGARPPLGPSAPQSSRLVAVAALMSIVLGVALATVIERMRSGFSIPEQVEAAVGLPMIAAVPEVSRAVLNGRRGGRPGVALAASLDRLRGQVRVQANTPPKVVMITSALPREGKSTLAAVFARNVAAAGLKVLLIECDFHCPELAREFRLPPKPGLCEILATGLPDGSTQAIHEVSPGLHVITAGGCEKDAQELLASEPMNMTLRAMQSRYDLILLDTPPVLARADALVLAQRADATIVVLRWERTARTPAQDAVRLLQDSRARILGVVMTRVDRRTAGRLGGRLSYAFRLYNTYGHARLRLG